MPDDSSELLFFDTFLDKKIHRPPARNFAKILLHTRMTPNRLTALSLVPAALSGLFLSRGNFTDGVIGVVYYYFWAVMDHTDGELARLKGCASEFGKKLDDACDFVATNVIFLGIFFGLLPYWNAFDQRTFKTLFLLGLILNAFSCHRVTGAKKVAPRFTPGRKILDSLTGRDAIYVLLAFVLLALFKHSSLWMSLSMGLLILGLYFISSICLIASLEMTKRSQS